MRNVLALLACANSMSAANIGSVTQYTLNCVYQAGPNSTLVTVTTIGAGQGSCPSTAVVQVDGSQYTGSLSGTATARALADVAYGAISGRASAAGAGMSGLDSSALVTMTFADQLAFFGAAAGIAGFELSASLAASRLDASAMLTPSIVFMLNNVAQLTPTLGYTGAPGQPPVGRVNGTAANVAYYVPFADGKMIPFSLAVSLGSSSGMASLADIALAISMQVRLYTAAGDALGSCTYASESGSPYKVICAGTTVASPEPGSLGLLGAGVLALAWLKRRS